MKTRIIIIALILCTSLFTHAQVEQVVRQLAENEHQKFASELPNAFAKGKVDLFGNARAVKKQFFLEENAKTFADFLGWDKKKYSQKTISNVFKSLSDNAKKGKISVKFDFPVHPTECIVTVQKEKRGTPKTEKKETFVTYVATTKANVRVDVNKQEIQTSTSNNVALIWDGKIKLVNGEVADHKNAPPKLRTIVISPVTIASEPNEELIRARIVELIEEYYNNLQSPTNKAVVLAPEIPNKVILENWIQNSTKIETDGYLNVALPVALGQFIEVSSVPNVNIYVDPAPFMMENVSQYNRDEAYHQLALTFTIDIKADKIIRVAYVDNFVVPELVPKPVLIDEPVPVIRYDPVSQPATPLGGGENYKVQILLRNSYIPLNELPELFRVENITVEKYDGQYKYVIPASSLNEALAIRNRLIDKGIDDAWIAVYESNGERIRPLQGKPEIIN